MLDFLKLENFLFPIQNEKFEVESNSYIIDQTKDYGTM